MSPEKWSQDVAALASDALKDAKVIDASVMDKATEIIAEEIWIRLSLGDYPPKHHGDT